MANEKMMNILMVTSAFPPYFGGAAIQATYLAQGLKARGVDVEFITDNEERPSVQAVDKGIRIYCGSSLFDNMLDHLAYAWCPWFAGSVVR